MKAWIVHAYGDMRLDDVPEPTPPAGWVKLRILVAQPSITEILLFQGERTYGHDIVARRLADGPAQLFGHEFCGEVVTFGAGVTGLTVGDRVTARGSHPDGIVGFDYPGAFAEFGIFPESLLARLPAGVSDAAGAAIQPLTDAVAAVAAADVRDRTVAVIGLGAMGLGCIQAARAGGARRVVAIGRRPAALALATRLGATDVIDASTGDPAEAVRALYLGGVDTVLECAGGPVDRGLAGDVTLLQAAAMVRDEGLVVGVAFDGNAAILPYRAFRFRGIGFRFPALLTRAMFEDAVAMVGDGRVALDPLLAPALAGIEHLPEAFERTAHKSRYGLVNPAQIRIGATQ